MNNLTPVIRNLLIVNVLIFISQSLSPFLHTIYITQLAFYNPLIPNGDSILINPNFQIYQVLTSMFLHGSLGHLAGNMFSLYILGSALETYMGSERFFIYYILCGIGANMFYAGVNYYELLHISPDSPEFISQVAVPSLGASGAVFGILVAYGYLFPNNELMIMFVPFPIKAKYFVILYGLFELFAGGYGIMPGIAHFAHVGGLVVGFILLILFNFKKGQYRY